MSAAFLLLPEFPLRDIGDRDLARGKIIAGEKARAEGMARADVPAAADDREGAAVWRAASPTRSCSSRQEPARPRALTGRFKNQHL
jgi:hypothetical protein